MRRSPVAIRLPAGHPRGADTRDAIHPRDTRALEPGGDELASCSRALRSDPSDGHLRGDRSRGARTPRRGEDRADRADRAGPPRRDAAPHAGARRPGRPRLPSPRRRRGGGVDGTDRAGVGIRPARRAAASVRRVRPVHRHAHPGHPVARAVRVLRRPLALHGWLGAPGVLPSPGTADGPGGGCHGPRGLRPHRRSGHRCSPPVRRHHGGRDRQLPVQRAAVVDRRARRGHHDAGKRRPGPLRGSRRRGPRRVRPAVLASGAASRGGGRRLPRRARIPGGAGASGRRHKALHAPRAVGALVRGAREPRRPVRRDLPGDRSRPRSRDRRRQADRPSSAPARRRGGGPARGRRRRAAGRPADPAGDRGCATPSGLARRGGRRALPDRRNARRPRIHRGESRRGHGVLRARPARADGRSRRAPDDRARHRGRERRRGRRARSPAGGLAGGDPGRANPIGRRWWSATTPRGP